MNTIYLTLKQARQFILLKQGLLGEYIYSDKKGALDFIKQAGCVQFDPVDVCGKNAEIVLNSRVKGFSKQYLYDLLYKDRLLIDYFDKNLSIMPIGDWKYFSRERELYRNRTLSCEKINAVEEEIKNFIHNNGCACSKDLGMKEKIDWYWSSTALSRAALESLYFCGDLVIHHKKGSIKYYSLASDSLPREILDAEDPCRTLEEHIQWRILRRIGAVGLLWNRASDAWLNIRGLTSSGRNLAFENLLGSGEIIAVNVEGIKETLYCLSSDTGLIEEIMINNKYKERTELIAPLDSLLWDRKLIEKLFGFSYKWEIYTPKEQRRYGHYVLPILIGDRFVGRGELLCERKDKKLIVNRVWLEDGIKNTKALSVKLDKCFKRFTKFNDCDEVIYNRTL